MNGANPKCDWYFDKPTPWQNAFKKLRTIILDCNLTEELKWGHPCYSCNGKNVVLMHGFKEYCALLFMKGALLKDTKKILVQQTENVQAARQIRFTDVKQIVKLEKVIRQYIFEAIELEKAGVKVEMKKTSQFNMPKEFEIQLKKNAPLKKAFYALTPGRQRGYLLYFSSAKQAKTREERVKKYI